MIYKRIKLPILLFSIVLIGLPSIASASIFGTASDIFSAIVAPLQGMAEEFSVAVSERTKSEATVHDSEVAEDTVTNIQDVTYQKGIEENQYSEHICRGTELLTSGSTGKIEATKEQEKSLLDGFMGLVASKTGSMGARPEDEQGAITIEAIQENCNPSDQSSAMKNFCRGTGGTSVLNPTNISGIANIDFDATTGEGEDAGVMGLLTNLFTNPIPSPEASLAEGNEDLTKLNVPFLDILFSKSTIANSFAKVLSPNIKTSTENTDSIRDLFESMQMSEDVINQKIPEDGRLSEDALMEIITQFYIARPQFFVDSQMDEANIDRLRVMLMAQSLRIDQKIQGLQEEKVKQMSALNRFPITESYKAKMAAIVSIVPE